MNFNLTLKQPQGFPQHGHAICTTAEIHRKSNQQHLVVVILTMTSLLPLGSFLTSYNDTFGVARLIISAWLSACANNYSKELYYQEHLRDKSLGVSFIFQQQSQAKSCRSPCN